MMAEEDIRYRFDDVGLKPLGLVTTATSSEKAGHVAYCRQGSGADSAFGSALSSSSSSLSFRKRRLDDSKPGKQKQRKQEASQAQSSSDSEDLDDNTVYRKFEQDMVMALWLKRSRSRDDVRSFDRVARVLWDNSDANRKCHRSKNGAVKRLSKMMNKKQGSYGRLRDLLDRRQRLDPVEQTKVSHAARAGFDCKGATAVDTHAKPVAEARPAVEVPGTNLTAGVSGSSTSTLAGGSASSSALQPWLERTKRVDVELCKSRLDQLWADPEVASQQWQLDAGFQDVIASQHIEPESEAKKHAFEGATVADCGSMPRPKKRKTKQSRKVAGSCYTVDLKGKAATAQLHEASRHEGKTAAKGPATVKQEEATSKEREDPQSRIQFFDRCMGWV